jgi:hypothetical protein
MNTGTVNRRRSLNTSLAQAVLGVAAASIQWAR